MLPWGTPARRRNLLEIFEFTWIQPCLFCRKLESQRTMEIGNFESCNFFIRPWIHTESKAFSASMKIATVLPVGLLLNHVVMCSDSLNNWCTQDLPFRKPHWNLFIRFLLTIYFVSLTVITRSKSFPKEGRREVGL